MATSWPYLLLTQCNPFYLSDSPPFPDGFLFITPLQGENGTVTRIIAGYPIVNIDLDQRAECHEGVRRVNDWTAHDKILLTMSRSGTWGDYVPLIFKISR